MTETTALTAIIEQYEKHGWKLRRVLLTRGLKDALNNISGVFGDAEILVTGQNGLWFSRRSLADQEAWELRRISASPFAVVEVIPDGLSDEERDEILSRAESRMFDLSRPQETSH